MLLLLDVIKVILQTPGDFYLMKQRKRQWGGSQGDRNLGRRQMQWSGIGRTRSLKVKTI